MKRRRRKSVKAKTIVKKEIVEIVADTGIGSNENVCRTLALCGEVNASGDDTLDKNPKKSAVAKPILEKEIIEIESDTDEVGGKMLTICGVENASGNGTLAENPENTSVVKTIVKKDITEIGSDTYEVGGKMLAICGVENALGDGTLAENPENTSVVKTIVKKDIIEIGSDTDTGAGSMQVVCANGSGMVHDLTYKQYLATFSEIGNEYLLEDNVRDPYPLRLMYNVDNEASDRSKGRAVKTKKRRAVKKEKYPMISSVSKGLKTDNGRADHNSISRTVFRTKETQKRTSVAKHTVTQRKQEDVQHVRTISMGKKNVKMKPTSNATSQTIFRASKRLKTEIGRADHNSISKTILVVNNKDTQQRKQKHNVESKISVTKQKIESKSTSYVKDSLLNSFKSLDKENKDIQSCLDKSYAYFLSGLKNAIIIYKSDPDIMSLSDPDIIAVSDRPFPDEDITPFEATKDGKVHDLEDDIEHDDVFNSLFSKKLMEVLRKPYDKGEFLRLYHEASLKRPLTRTRQLRDGREIQYDLEDQLTPSYLEIYPDFNNKCRHHRKDLPRALNLLRGFFFYLENIVVEGAFKPWLYEKRLRDMCFDASGCKYIAYNK